MFFLPVTIMSMNMGAGGASSVANLPLSDPRCNSVACTAFYAAENASQAAVSYSWQYQYGHWTTWYYLGFIFLFMLAYAYHLYNDRPDHGNASSSGPPSLVQKATGLIRSCTYRRFSGRIADSLGLPSFGVIAFILLAVLFALVATFAIRPYYRQHRGYGSPPLAVRTGLMAVALTPIIFALSGKVNIVTMLTGIGHEKLNAIHRYAAYLCFGLSVAHTIPFIVAPLKDGGPAALHRQYYKSGGFEVSTSPHSVQTLLKRCDSIPERRPLLSSSSWSPFPFLGYARASTSCSFTPMCWSQSPILA